MQTSDVGDAHDLAKYRLATAKEDFTVAKENLQNGHYKAANNRAYYAVYHAVTAALALEGVAFKKHKDTLAYFNKNFVQKSIFPREEELIAQVETYISK